jgi:hypothetical protein
MVPGPEPQNWLIAFIYIILQELIFIVTPKVTPNNFYFPISTKINNLSKPLILVRTFLRTN